MKVTIKTMVGTAYHLEVDSSDDVETLLLKIEKIEGTPVKEQRLLFIGRQLKEGRTLGSYRIREGSILQLIIRYVRC